jgi:iron-sulfur cluster repair protein YtfE (RIC family)
MPGRPTDAIRREHDGILEQTEHLRQIAHALPDLTWNERTNAVGAALDFLRGTLLPHADAEEAVLYPVIAKLLDQPDLPAAMVYDHREIAGKVDTLAHADLSDTTAIQELLYGLSALIVLHVHKEDEIYLAVLDAQPRDVAERIVAEQARYAASAHRALV